MVRLIFPTPVQWQMLCGLGILAQGGGLIIVDPDIAADLTKEGATPDDHNGDMVEYSFGGSPDMMLDVVCDHGHYAMAVIREELNLSPAEEEEDEAEEDTDAADL